MGKYDSTVFIDSIGGHEMNLGREIKFSNWTSALGVNSETTRITIGSLILDVDRKELLRAVKNVCEEL